MDNRNAFLSLVNDAKSRIKEMTVPEFVEFTSKGERFFLVDVREDHEWVPGRLPGAGRADRSAAETTEEARPLVW